MWRFARRYFSASIPKSNEADEILLGDLGKDYTKAIEFVKESNFVQAEEKFRSTLESLTNQGMFGQPVYNFILQRIALLLRAQKKTRECEKTLEEIVMNYKAKEKEFSHQLGTACENLLKQYLQSNIDKALRFGQFILREDNWNALHRHAQKDLKFLIGTAFLLKDNCHNEAKSQFYECLNMNPGANTCFVLHNLSIAQWWHATKYQENNISELHGPQLSEYKKAVMEFSEAVPNLQKAIQLFEALPEAYDPLDKNTVLKNKLSGLSLTALTEIELESPLYGQDKILNSLKKLLKFYEDNDKGNIGKAMTLVGMFMCENEERGQGLSLLRSALEFARGKNDYNEVFVYSAYGNALGGEKQAKYSELANKIIAGLPYWAERSAYLHIPVWDL